MSFDYERAVWGKNTASCNIGDPTSIRFGRMLKIVKNLKKGAKVLEIGSGAGQFIRGVKRLHQDFDCYGVDISEQAIATALLQNDGVKYVVQKNEVPFEDSYFDAVFILDVLEHAENWREILSETRRVLKNNGLFYIFVPCEGAKTSIWNCLRKIGLGNDLTKKYAGHINYFKPTEIYDELKKLNLNFSRSFSEHVLGQLLGVAVFYAMDLRANKKQVEVLNNENYFENEKNGKGVKLFKWLVNALVFVESCLFQKIPSPNLHIFGQKTVKNA